MAGSEERPGGELISLPSWPRGRGKKGAAGDEPSALVPQPQEGQVGTRLRSARRTVEERRTDVATRIAEQIAELEAVSEVMLDFDTTIMDMSEYGPAPMSEADRLKTGAKLAAEIIKASEIQVKVCRKLAGMLTQDEIVQLFQDITAIVGQFVPQETATAIIRAIYAQYSRRLNEWGDS